ncbi:MAG TPA: hypothetical protein VLW86_00900 [Syntrophorhabdales bacterium]|nr:hypothetical protein [Syntrophorhabdales bacterium]
MKQRIKIWHPMALALLTGALLFCGTESAREGTAQAQAPVPAAGPALSSPALTVRQGEGSPAGSADGGGQALFIEVKDKDKISANVKNRPLDELLRTMSQKNLFEIRGPLPRGEGITVEFSNLTLEQALKKLMKGYNYVLMDQGASRKPLLMVMGPATRGAYGEQGQAQPAPQPVVNQPPVQNAPNAPPAPAIGQPGPPPQRVPRVPPAAGQEAGIPPGQPQQPVAQPVVNQPQPGAPPEVNSGPPNAGGQAAGQPQPEQPPVQGGQAGEAPVPSSVTNALPSGF